VSATTATFVGIVLGAALSVAVALSNEWRVKRRERRTAKRLIVRELEAALWGIGLWLEADAPTRPTKDELLNFPAWKGYHSQAAGAMKQSAWEAVSDAYLALNAIRYNEAYATPLKRSQRGDLESAAGAVRVALRELGESERAEAPVAVMGAHPPAD